LYTATDDVLDALLPDNKKMRESDPSMKPPTVPPFEPAEAFLSGTVHAQSSTDAQGKNVPKRDYFALASWMSLARKH
jgi:hypothetical protein